MAPDASESVRDQLAAALGPEYEIERELGRGGFAVVFLVRDLRLKRPLAVKVLNPELIASKTALDRSHLEAQTVAQLSHPHIVPLHFVGGEGGFFYIAMTFVDGQSLADQLEREGELSVQDTTRILTEMADALDFAHRRGVVHRDVKPDNVLLDRETGRSLLTDFGIARSSLSAAKLTATGLAIGTPAYMSPEQLAGDTVDLRTDLYALGAMGYQMLTGTVPFAEGGSPMAIMAKRLSEAPDSVAAHRPDVPQHLVEVIMRCLAIEPNDRFESAAEIVSILKGRTPVSGSRVTGPIRASGRPPSRRTVVWLVGGAGLVSAALVGWVVLRSPAEPDAPPVPPPPAAPTIPEGMVLVPGGSYTIGRDDGHEWSRPAHTAVVDSFAIGRTEVTVADYKRYVKATRAAEPWTAEPDSLLPVTRVTWAEANAYCGWAYDGGRLPTEEQWEAAARGVDGTVYPWGAEPEPGRANTLSAGRSGPAPVGSFPQGASPVGAQDLIGNVWEWTSSRMLAYPGGSAPSGGDRYYVTRGGAYNTQGIVDATRRGYMPPTTGTREGFEFTGFRCVVHAGG